MAIGTKFPWTAAGWFDALNLRTNGFDFHIQLMDGKVPYTDPKVKEVFAKWKQLIDAGFFLPNNSNYSWQESVPFLMNGKAAMILIGNFFSQTIPDNMKDKFGFFPFPTINPDIPDAEDAPVDTIHIPAKAKNKAGARKFLEFVAKPETQQMIAVESKIFRRTRTQNHLLIRSWRREPSFWQTPKRRSSTIGTPTRKWRLRA